MNTIPRHKYPDIFTLMEQVERPRIKLRTRDHNLTVVLSRYGERSKFSGCIRLTDGQWPNDRWYGFIKHNGLAVISRDCTIEERDDIHLLLQRLNDNPAETAAAYGRDTGQCCFCTRPLTDERSLTTGYGPVCAKKYYLPWGDTAATTLKEFT